jgi:co-chaperonin GroES (HSP10)
MSKVEEFNPGLTPLEYKVIVYPYPVKEEYESSIEGLVKSVNTEKQDRMEQTRGVLIDFTDMAFSEWKCELPERGQEIEFSRLSGQFFIGKDGKEYKLMNDQDLVGFFKGE